MARSSGYPRGRPRSSGVARDWGVGPGGTTSTQLSASGSALLGSAVTLAGSEITAMRTRGLFTAFISSTGAGDGDGYFGAVGIGKATAAAHTAGIASLPTPITEADWDGWMWHSFFHVFIPDLTFGLDSQYQRIEIDSKAMRKFDQSEVLYAAVEVVEVGTVVLKVHLDTRMLFQDSGR